VDGTDRAGIRWYELRNNGAGWLLQQQSTFAPADGQSRWMGSLAMDAAGNMALGYSKGSASMYASIMATGRLSADPPNLITQGELLLMPGAGSQTGGTRWGDYSMLSIDPQDDCTFWYTNEYMANTSSDGWHTRIHAFRYPGCAAIPVGQISGQVTEAGTGTPIAGALVSSNGYQTQTDSTGNYVFILPVGVHDLAVSAYSYISQSASGLVVSEGANLNQDFALSKRPASSVHGVVREGGAHGWPLYAHIQVTAENYTRSLYTDAFDGSYSLDLYQGIDYQFTVNAVLAGYSITNASLTPTAADQTEDFALGVDLEDCSAAGYQLSSGLEQRFEGTSLPAGWLVTDEVGQGKVWSFQPTRSNNTGGTGNFAIADSDWAGTGSMTTALVSPPVDLSAESEVVLQFKYDYYDYRESGHKNPTYPIASTLKYKINWK